MDGSDVDEYNDGAFSANDGGHAADDFGFHNAARTREFQPPHTPWRAGGGLATFPAAAQPFAGSNSSNPRMGLQSLNLNDTVGWPEMDAYAGYLRSGDNVTAVPPPPPVRVPSRGACRNLGFRAPRSARSAGSGGGGAAMGAGGWTSSDGGGFPEPLPQTGGSTRRRGRSPRIRGPGPAIAADNFDADDNTPASQLQGNKSSKCKADWSLENTQLFCNIWCHQMDINNVVGNALTKTGWKELTNRYYAATGLLHTREQFMSHFRKLRGQWQFANKLRNDSGLGRNEAPDHWWKANTKGHSDWAKMRNGLPDYLPQLDRMFEGHVVDGSTSFVAGESTPINCDSSDDVEADEQDDQVTPLSNSTPKSSGSKRANSTSTTASSPHKRSKSPAVRAMDNNMREHNEISRNKLAVLQSIWHEKKESEEDARMALARKVDQVNKLAAECGVTPEDAPQLFIGVVKIVQIESVMDLFINTIPAGRLIIIKQYAGVNN
ncbi:unnamed protein product [Urochloa humidicola]